MPISLLRRPSRPREPDVPPAIGHISFPDLTGPLIDTSAWSTPPRNPSGVETTSYNDFAPNGRTRQQVDTNLGPMPRGYPMTSPTSPPMSSSTGHGSSYGPSPTDSHDGHFHPTLPTSTSFSSRMPSRVRDANGNPLTSFHRPFVRDTSAPPPAMSPPAPRSRKSRRLATLSIMVVGPSGSGKTCFIDALSSVLDPKVQRLSVRAGPTTNVSRTEIVAASERRSLNLFDTPGLPLPAAGNVKRLRALDALLGIVEDRLAHHLSEESKVVRRKADGADLITLIIYVVDARTVLVKPPIIEIDWDTIAEPPAKAGRPLSSLDQGGIEARFPIEDIEAIRKFSVRANVLPVLTHADALTTNELNAVRHAVVRDLTTVFGRDPLGSWGILSTTPGPEVDVDEDETDGGAQEHKNIPFAVFSPEMGECLTREFRWGSAAADDAAHSDLPAVCDALMSAAEFLRTSTREGVYEKFRTEKLLSARGVHAQA